MRRLYILQALLLVSIVTGICFNVAYWVEMRARVGSMESRIAALERCP